MGQCHLGDFLEKADLEVGPEMWVERCEMPEAEAGRAFQVKEQHEHGGFQEKWSEGL